MTMINIERKKCANCKTISQFFKETSYSILGFGDLDFRKNCSLREIILDSEIEQCPYCGYISTDIEYKSKEYDAFCKSELYYSFYNEKFDEINKTAQRFIKFAIYKDWIGDYDEAYTHLLKAAWKFDDLGEDESAVRCRKKAIEILKKIEDKDHRQILELLDLYRRSGEFKAIELMLRECFFENEWDEKISKYQLYLASKGDDSRHCIEEALIYCENI